MKNWLISFREWLLQYWEPMKEFFTELADDVKRIGYSVLEFLVTHSLIIILVLVFSAGLYYVFAKDSAPLTDGELRVFALLFLFFFFILAISSLRIYNSIVNNSSFMLRLQKQVQTNTQKASELERTIVALRATMEKANDSLKSLGRELGNTQDALHSSSRTIKDLGTALRNTKNENS